jgi:hypothetical protein
MVVLDGFDNAHNHRKIDSLGYHKDFENPMHQLTDLREDIYTESDASRERIQIDIPREYRDLENNDHNVCEYVDCSNKANMAIEVRVGTSGVITLFLCNKCVREFKDEQK